MIDKNKYQILQPFLLSVMVALGMLVGLRMKDPPRTQVVRIVKPVNGSESLSQAVGLINRYYVDEVENNELVNNAIISLVQDLDAYSSYVSPGSRSVYDLYNSGKYIGLGIETTQVDDALMISKVLDSGPAMQNKILKGSRILAVNELDIKMKNWNVDSLSLFLDKNEEKTMTMDIDHVTYDEIKRIQIHPDEVGLRNVKDVYKIDADVGYINLARFGEGTYADFMKSLEVIVVDDRLKNLIIDLRSNPGGFLDEVCKIVDQFLEKEEEFLQTVVKEDRTKSYKSKGRPFFKIDNIVILINKNSASASEILAGVLQDLDRAVIVGEHSFGKGLVQEQFNLSNGGVLRLSVSHYVLPSGRKISLDSEKDTSEVTVYSKKLNRKLSAVGPIVPDYEVMPRPISSNESFRYAIEELKRGENWTEMTYEGFMDQYQMIKYGALPEDSKQEIKYEMASILFQQPGLRKKMILADPYVVKALELFSEGDTWGILKVDGD